MKKSKVRFLLFLLAWIFLLVVSGNLMAQSIDGKGGLSIVFNTAYVETDVLTDIRDESIESVSYTLIGSGKDNSASSFEIGAEYEFEVPEFAGMNLFVEGGVFFWDGLKVSETFDWGGGFKMNAEREAEGQGIYAGAGFSKYWEWRKRPSRVKAVFGFKNGKSTIEIVKLVTHNDVAYDSSKDDEDHTSVQPYGRISIDFSMNEKWSLGVSFGASTLEVKDPVRDDKFDDMTIEGAFGFKYYLGD